MSARPGFERLVTDWLHADATAAGSDRVLAAALVRVSSIGQERRRFTWRGDRPTGLAQLGLIGAGALLVALVAAQLLPNGDDVGGGVGASPSSTPQPVLTPADGYPDAGFLRGATDLSIDGVRFSVDVPAGWEGFGRLIPNYISKSTVGPQGAEAKLFWTTYPAPGWAAEECAYLRSRNLPQQVSRPDPPTGPSSVDLAAAVAEVPGTDLVSGPADVSVGGFPAMYVEFVVRDDVGCDPGFFFIYPTTWGGALWPETVPGDTIRVWIVDLGRTRFFIEGATHDNAGPDLILEVQAIVDSIRFE
jgi:hypothetical protein